jgi:hypothetical protein
MKLRKLRHTQHWQKSAKALQTSSLPAFSSGSATLVEWSGNGVKLNVNPGSVTGCSVWAAMHTWNFFVVPSLMACKYNYKIHDKIQIARNKLCLANTWLNRSKAFSNV